MSGTEMLLNPEHLREEDGEVGEALVVVDAGREEEVLHT